MTKRKDKTERRNLNTEEMEAMGFTDFSANNNEDGWPYPDDDDDETTERYSIEKSFTRGRSR